MTPIVLGRGADHEVRPKLNEATGALEIRSWGRLSERDAFAPHMERLVLPIELMPMVQDALGQLEAEAEWRELTTTEPRGPLP